MFNREQNIIKSQLDDSIIEMMEKTGAFIAGGAVTSVFSSSPINDFDIFFPNKEALEKGLAKFKDKEKDDKTISTDCAFSFVIDGKRYQLIKVLTSAKNEVLDSFDFTICQGAYGLKDGFVLGNDFLRHLAQRKLVFNITAKYPICSLYRTRKFMKRGFEFSGIEAVKLGLRIQALKLETYADLREQLLGIDTLFLKELTDSLKNEAEKKYDLNEFLETLEKFLWKFETVAGDE